MATITISCHNRRRIFLLACTMIIVACSYSQTQIDSVLHKLDPQKWVASISKKANKLEEKIRAKSEKTLNRLQRQEEKIYRRMLRTKDSLQAKAALTGIQDKYQSFRDKLKNPIINEKAGHYLAKLDTLKTALKFLDKNGIAGNVQDALAKTTSLQDKFSQAEAIKNFIRERRQQLKAELEKLGLVKELKKFNKEIYYYSAQIKEYKEILKDSKKAERKALELLSKTKFFKDFMRKNSQLASLFRLPGDPNDPSTQASLAGLQTRAQVNNLIQQQITAGGPGAQQQFSQNLQAAQSQLQNLKNKIGNFGGGSSDDIMPEGFKPNNEKKKSFLKRLEYGTNIQTQKATNFFPVTSDIGLSLGYKLNDKSIIGIGASYKMGWGRGWNNLRISHQGLGLRSYADIKLKGSLWISAGYEQNYKTPFSEFSQLQYRNAWQQSGLVGMSKVISIKTKFFKKTKVQLLWDFLSYQQRPQTQPVVFRIGYNIK
jgi:hypothetical protein